MKTLHYIEEGKGNQFNCPNVLNIGRKFIYHNKERYYYKKEESRRISTSYQQYLRFFDG